MDERLRFVARAAEAARCYSAHAFYACCAMVGAAAESILAAAGSAKLREPTALRLYGGTTGRKALTDAVLQGCPDHVAREFRLRTGLMDLWRDQSAHTHVGAIGETEAFTNMRGLIKCAQFSRDTRLAERFAAILHDRRGTLALSDLWMGPNCCIETGSQGWQTRTKCGPEFKPCGQSIPLPSFVARPPQLATITAQNAPHDCIIDGGALE